MADQRIRVRIEGETGGFDRALQRANSGAERFAQQIADRFVFGFDDIERAARAAFDVINDAAAFQGQEEALQRQVANYDEYIAKLREVSDAQISNARLVEASNRALALGIEQARIPELLEIARGASVQLGTDFTQAFDDIVTGIGRASPLILDNLGIVVKLGDAYSNAADQLGKTTSELTTQERSAALLNDVIANNLDTLGSFADAQDETAAALNRTSAALDDARLKVGEIALAFAEGATESTNFSGKLGLLVSGLEKVEPLADDAGNFFAKFVEILARGNPVLGLFASSLDFLAATTKDATDDLENVADAAENAGDAAEEAAPKFGIFGEEADAAAIRFKKFVLEFAAAKDTVEENTEAIVIGGEAYDEFGRRLPTEEVGEFDDSMDAASAAIRTNTEELRRNIEEQRRLREEARLTTSELQQLAIALGIDPNDPNLALTQGGTRLRFTGGSRIVRTSGFTTTAGTLQFRNGQQVRVTPDGRVERTSLVQFS